MRFNNISFIFSLYVPKKYIFEFILWSFSTFSRHFLIIKANVFLYWLNLTSWILIICLHYTFVSINRSRKSLTPTPPIKCCTARFPVNSIKLHLHPSECILNKHQGAYRQTVWLNWVDTILTIAENRENICLLTDTDSRKRCRDLIFA